MYTTESHPNHALPQPAHSSDQHLHHAGKDAVRAVDIPGGRLCADGVVRYTVEVTDSKATWLIAKRFSQFEQLHLLLIQLFLDVVSLPDLPPKKLKLFQSHNSPAFIEKRALLLTNYLRKLLDNKRLANSKLVHDFFATDRCTDPALSHTAHRTAQAAAPFSAQSTAIDAPLPASTSFTSAPSTASSSPTDPSPFLSSPPGTPTSSSQFRLPADSEISALSIPTHRLVNGAVLYAIHCSSPHRPPQLAHWTQLKRFSQLVAMDERLRASLWPQCDEAERRRRLDAIPERPAKRVSLGSGGGADRGSIEERRVLMEHYLRSLLLNDECRKNKHLLEFLGVEG